MSEIEDTKPSSILWNNKLMNRAMSPFVPPDSFSRALTFQKHEDDAGVIVSSPLLLLESGSHLLLESGSNIELE